MQDDGDRGCGPCAGRPPGAQRLPAPGHRWNGPHTYHSSTSCTGSGAASRRRSRSGSSRPNSSSLPCCSRDSTCQHLQPGGQAVLEVAELLQEQHVGRGAIPVDEHDVAVRLHVEHARGDGQHRRDAAAGRDEAVAPRTLRVLRRPVPAIRRLPQRRRGAGRPTWCYPTCPASAARARATSPGDVGAELLWRDAVRSGAARCGRQPAPTSSSVAIMTTPLTSRVTAV